MLDYAHIIHKYFEQVRPLETYGLRESVKNPDAYKLLAADMDRCLAYINRCAYNADSGLAESLVDIHLSARNVDPNYRAQLWTTQRLLYRNTVTDATRRNPYHSLMLVVEAGPVVAPQSYIMLIPYTQKTRKVGRVAVYKSKGNLPYCTTIDPSLVKDDNNYTNRELPVNYRAAPRPRVNNTQKCNSLENAIRMMVAA